MKQGNTHTECNLNTVTWRLKGEILEPDGRPLLGSASVKTSSPLQRWRQATLGEPRVAVIPEPEGQCRCNGTRDTTLPTSTEERCFLLGPFRGYYLENQNKPVSLSRECRQKSTERLQVETSPSLRLLWDSRPWWRRGRRRSHHCLSRCLAKPSKLQDSR
jgi:hypothetical protein